jgi:hypothetical protein
MKYFSEVYQVDKDENKNWFNPRLDRDTELFIDPFLVFKNKSDIPQFRNAKNKFMDFFISAFKLAYEARESELKYKKLLNMLKFPEVPEICLGFTFSSTSGSGTGGGFSKIFADAIIELVSAGRTQLEHFEEVEIFTERIGRDRISDTTANILKLELIKYTRDICQKLNIQTNYTPIMNVEFDAEYLRWEDSWDDKCFSLPKNPLFEKRAVILVPVSFLRAEHAISSNGFSAYLKNHKNEELRNDLNYEISKSLSKSRIRDIINQRPSLVPEYISYIENDANISPYDIELDERNLYQFDKKAYEFVRTNPLQLSASNLDEFIITIKQVINQYCLFIEDKTGYKLLWHGKGSSANKEEPISQHEAKGDCLVPKQEDAAQSLLKAIVVNYCETNNIEFSKEEDIGQGCIEFKFLSGYSSRTLIELKLARNLNSPKKLEQAIVKPLSQYLQVGNISCGYYIVIIYNKKEYNKLEQVCTLIDSLSTVYNIQLKVIPVDATPDKESNTPNQVEYSKSTNASTILVSAQSSLEAKEAFSATERRELLQKLSALPAQQFNMLLFTLKLPDGVIPSMSSPQGDRAYALVTWAEGWTGCGLLEVKQTLDEIINTR